MSITRKEALMKGEKLRPITREDALLLKEDILPFNIDESAIKSIANGSSDGDITWFPVTISIEDLTDQVYGSRLEIFVKGFDDDKSFNVDYMVSCQTGSSASQLFYVPCIDSKLEIGGKKILVPFPIQINVLDLSRYVNSHDRKFHCECDGVSSTFFGYPALDTEYIQMFAFDTVNNFEIAYIKYVIEYDAK